MKPAASPRREVSRREGAVRRIHPRSPADARVPSPDAGPMEGRRRALRPKAPAPAAGAWWRLGAPDLRRLREGTSAPSEGRGGTSRRACSLTPVCEAIGCAIAPRAAYTRLARSRIFQPIDAEPVWSVSCFSSRSPTVAAGRPSPAARGPPVREVTRGGSSRAIPSSREREPAGPPSPDRLRVVVCAAGFAWRSRSETRPMMHRDPAARGRLGAAPRGGRRAADRSRSRPGSRSALDSSRSADARTKAAARRARPRGERVARTVGEAQRREDRPLDGDDRRRDRAADRLQSTRSRRPEGGAVHWPKIPALLGSDSARKERAERASTGARTDLDERPRSAAPSSRGSDAERRMRISPRRATSAPDDDERARLVRGLSQKSAKSCRREAARPSAIRLRRAGA
jgi:hypothetical protein